jgi:hypothetical protein
MLLPDKGGARKRRRRRKPASEGAPAAQADPAA